MPPFIFSQSTIKYYSQNIEAIKKLTNYNYKLTYTYAGVKATNGWYNEINECGYSYALGGSFKEGCNILHFSQLVWAGHLKAGFGLASDKSGSNFFIVAHYTPQGNVLGQFQNNVFPPTTNSTELVTRCWLLWSEELNKLIPITKTYQTESLSKMNY